MKRLLSAGMLIWLAACAANAPGAGTVQLPSGAAVKVIDQGPVPSAAQPTYGLHYQTSVPDGNGPALHAEALAIWRFFRLAAEAQGVGRAVLTPEASQAPREGGIDFAFARIDGVWHEVDRSGRPVDAPQAHLSAAMAPMSWLIGTWTCQFSSVTDNFVTQTPRTAIDQPGPNGTTVDQTYAVSFDQGGSLGEIEIGYIPSRKVWYRRGRETPDTVEYEEAPGPASRDMTFSGTAQTSGKPALQLQKRFQVDASGTTERQSTVARIGGQSILAKKGECKKVSPGG